MEEKTSGSGRRPVVYALVGPTGVGKTEVGLVLAERLDAEIISADSRQIYRYMDIGTAKPTPEERRRIRHHLIDVVAPDEPFSAGEYGRRARQAIGDVRRRGRRPLIVGGAGLYIRALAGGLFTAPEIPDAVRARLRSRAGAMEAAALHRELGSVDPPAAARIHPNDRQRIVRALEVYEATGTPLTQWQRTASSVPPPFRIRCIGLRREREGLYARIDTRVDRMMAAGLVREVRALLDRGYASDARALQTFGYAEIIAYLEGVLPYDAAVEKIKRQSRRYAKRQMTWFRRAGGIEWVTLREGMVLQACEALFRRMQQAVRPE